MVNWLMRTVSHGVAKRFHNCLRGERFHRFRVYPKETTAAHRKNTTATLQVPTNGRQGVWQALLEAFWLQTGYDCQKGFRTVCGRLTQAIDC